MKELRLLDSLNQQRDSKGKQYSARDVLLFLSHLKASLGYDDWWHVGSFMRHNTQNFFDDPLSVFTAWSATSEAPTHKHKLGEIPKQWESWKLNYRSPFFCAEQRVSKALVECLESVPNPLQR